MVRRRWEASAGLRHLLKKRIQARSSRPRRRRTTPKSSVIMTGLRVPTQECPVPAVSSEEAKERGLVVCQNVT